MAEARRPVTWNVKEKETGWWWLKTSNSRDRGRATPVDSTALQSDRLRVTRNMVKREASQLYSMYNDGDADFAASDG